jgi:hypothetical protein
MQMIMFVLDNPDQLDELLSAWRAVGMSGVTIIESTGFHRHHAQKLATQEMPIPAALPERIDKGHYTLFAVVPDVEAAQECLYATESVVGDLDAQSTGVFATWETTLTKGVLTHLLRPELPS